MTAYMIKTKRVYDKPAKTDGYRVLVDRLWPRGVGRTALRLNAWLKEAAPSAGLRRWFGHDPARWPEFQQRYRLELEAHPDAWRPILARARRGTVTLLYGARDAARNNAIVLREVLEEQRIAAGASAAESLLESRDLPRSSHRAPAAATLPEPGGFSSPPCYAHEIAPDYFGYTPAMPRDELVDLLNVLLEAERAGARVVAVFLNDYERDTAPRRRLAEVQRDEAKNCAILIELIRRLDGTPSTATGDFLGKALAVEGAVARLQFLNRGQKWVARKISDALPRVEQGVVRDALFAMHESHLLNIEACDALAETPGA